MNEAASAERRANFGRKIRIRTLTDVGTAEIAGMRVTSEAWAMTASHTEEATTRITRLIKEGWFEPDEARILHTHPIDRDSKATWPCQQAGASAGCILVDSIETGVAE